MRIFKFSSNLFFLINLFYIGSLWATNDIYEYTNSSGQTVFSNKIKDKAAKKISLPPLNIYAVPMSQDDINATGYTIRPALTKNITMMQPVVNTDAMYFTPKQNKTRTQILEDELHKEELALASSKKLLETGQNIKPLNENKSTYNDRIRILEDAITEHEKNIEILKKEINNNYYTNGS